MAFFSFLFPRLAPATIEDDFFGHLTLESGSQYGSAYCWYAERVMFQPIGSAIECLIGTADTAGPTPSQQAFFQYVEKIYKPILPAVIAVVENDSRLLAAGCPFVDFASTHRLAGITIPELTTAPVNWSLWFEPLDTSHWGYSVEVGLLDDVPQEGIGISA